MGQTRGEPIWATQARVRFLVCYAWGMMDTAHTTHPTARAPYAALGLLLAGAAWLYAGFALAGAYVDALWSDPPPQLVGASVAWIAVGAVAVVWLHVALLVRVWRGE